MLEFALAAILFLLLVFGILEVSRLVFATSSVNNSAREGAHYAALHPESTVYTLTQQIAPKLIFISPAQIQVTLNCPTCSGPGTCLPPACNSAIYQPLTVTIGYTLTTGVPLPGFGNGIPITARATARRER
jgi:Flp pilus assembly protein TadG